MWPAAGRWRLDARHLLCYQLRNRFARRGKTSSVSPHRRSAPSFGEGRKPVKFLGNLCEGLTLIFRRWKGNELALTVYQILLFLLLVPHLHLRDPFSAKVSFAASSRSRKLLTNVKISILLEIFAWIQQMTSWNANCYHSVRIRFNWAHLVPMIFWPLQWNRNMSVVYSPSLWEVILLNPSLGRDWVRWFSIQAQYLHSDFVQNKPIFGKWRCLPCKYMILFWLWIYLQTENLLHIITSE